MRRHGLSSPGDSAFDGVGRLLNTFVAHGAGECGGRMARPRDPVESDESTQGERSTSSERFVPVGERRAPAAGRVESLHSRPSVWGPETSSPYLTGRLRNALKLADQTSQDGSVVDPLGMCLRPGEPWRDRPCHTAGPEAHSK